MAESLKAARERAVHEAMWMGDAAPAATELLLRELQRQAMEFALGRIGFREEPIGSGRFELNVDGSRIILVHGWCDALLEGLAPEEGEPLWRRKKITLGEA